MQTLVDLSWIGPFKRGNLAELPTRREASVYVWILRLERAIVVYGGKSHRAGGMAGRANEHLRDFLSGQYWRYTENAYDMTSEPKGVSTFETVDDWIQRSLHHVKNIEFYHAACPLELLSATEAELNWQLKLVCDRSDGKIIWGNEPGSTRGRGRIQVQHADGVAGAQHLVEMLQSVLSVQ